MAGAIVKWALPYDRDWGLRPQPHEVIIMHWLLALLAAFNLFSMYMTFQSRSGKRQRVRWAVFGFALLSTELAWLWLPVQFLLAFVFCAAGALHSGIGKVALILLVLSWAGLGWSIWQGSRAGRILESALQKTLGPAYQDSIPAERRGTLRDRPTFTDWKLPFAFSRPGVEVIRDVAYGPLGQKQQLDIYRPQNMSGKACPVLLQIHGGAWILSKKDDQALSLMNYLASRGWICVAINYRLSPSVGFPTHLLDCKKALCWIRENGASYGMDTDFVAVTGGSAGGHLAALMALTANYPELQSEHPDTDTALQAAVPLYGIYDFLDRFGQHANKEVLWRFLEDKVMFETAEQNADLWELASPISHLREDAPPFMVLHGSHDSIIPVGEARVFVEKLREKSRSPVVYAEMPFAEHGWELMRSIRGEYTVYAMHRFLEWALAQHRGAVGQAVPELDDAAAG